MHSPLLLLTLRLGQRAVAPLIAAAAKARAAIAAEGRKGAEEFIGGYRTSARSAAAALSSVQKSEEAVTAAAEKSADKQIAAAKRVAREKQKAHETAWNFTKKQLEEELKMNQARTRSIISGTASGVATLARMGAGVVGAAAQGAGHAHGVAGVPRGGVRADRAPRRAVAAAI